MRRSSVPDRPPDMQSGDRTSQPPFRARKLDLERQRGGDIKVPKGGLPPLAPTIVLSRDIGDT